MGVSNKKTALNIIITRDWKMFTHIENKASGFVAHKANDFVANRFDSIQIVHLASIRGFATK